MTRRKASPSRTAAAALAAALTGALAGCLPAGGDTGGSGGRTPSLPVGAGVECPRVKAPGDSPARQLRAMWIATVGGIDWPRSHDPAKQRAEYIALLETARSMRLNAVFVQIRPQADAFYDSPHEPWSKWITGTPGKDPGYDVLKFMVKEARARNLEFHAWFNPYRIARHEDIDKLAPDSPARKNPDWVRTYGGLWYDPGLPQVRDLATKAVMDVVTKYDIDAVHFDDYFYPYPEGDRDYPDEATYKRYGGGMGKADWRRNNVDTLVRDLSARIRAAKPWVRFGISPFGVWRNKSTDPAGSDTRALQSYDDQYADTRKWIQKGWVDYITPQLYWPIGDPRADYRELVRWWSEQVEGTGVRLTIGQGAYRVGQGGDWDDPAELSRHLTLNRRHPQVRGDVYFSAKDLAGNRRGFAERLRRDHYTRPAVPPVVPGRDGEAPPPVRGVTATPGATAGDGRGGTTTGVRVRWKTVEDAESYAVYRVEGDPAKDGADTGGGDGKGVCAPVDPDTLIADVRGGGVIDPGAKPGTTYTYFVTALDRLHRESPPARGATVTTPKKP